MVAGTADNKKKISLVYENTNKITNTYSRNGISYSVDTWNPCKGATAETSAGTAATGPINIPNAKKEVSVDTSTIYMIMLI